MSEPRPDKNGISLVLCKPWARPDGDQQGREVRHHRDGRGDAGDDLQGEGEGVHADLPQAAGKAGAEEQDVRCSVWHTHVSRAWARMRPPCCVPTVSASPEVVSRVAV